MKIIADLHVHSKYSRATAKNLDLENLHVCAQIKGIQLVATGDFSHPAWFNEIETKLEPSEPGLLRLKSDPSKFLEKQVPPVCRGAVRFVLVTEISNIYKRAGRTRKNHNLVFVPDLDAAKKLNHRLERIGNIQSDGRPILGLDTRDLLEVVLETSSEAFLVPAHIWTPWFSVLGSKSGFDSIRECFGDLTPHVFAAETGLSSDPAMNWRVSSLDDITLISNSDAHSPSNLGREANIFDIEMSFHALRGALKSADPGRFLGTIEFYPEEGKYHLDGHRSCGVRLDPKQTMDHHGICPQCGKPLTIGVLNRVEQLADRAGGLRPRKARPYRNLIPLGGILAEILQVGPKAQKVLQAYRSAVEKLGPEFTILDQLEAHQIENAGIPLLAEAVLRMRTKKIEIRPGFDGEYGTIKIFNSQERAQIRGQRSLFAMPAGSENKLKPKNHAEPFPAPEAGTIPALEPSKREPRDGGACLNADQHQAVVHEASRILIEAGPGTGKTHTLTCRIAHLIAVKKVEPQRILAVTFTNQAAEEMRIRLRAMLGDPTSLPFIATFHALCLKLLQELNPSEVFTLIDDSEQAELIFEAMERVAESGVLVSLKPLALQDRIVRAKQNMVAAAQLPPPESTLPEDSVFYQVYRAYQQLLESQRYVDFEDLIFNVVYRLETDPGFQHACRERFQHVFVDEYQDLNHAQYRMIRALAPSRAASGSLCVIGDPHQSIYGFRGSDAAYFRHFIEDYPDAGVVTLARNYRSTETILAASHQIIAPCGSDRARIYSNIDGVPTISILELPNAHAEAESIARIIESRIGGTGFHSIDTGRVGDPHEPDVFGYADFAVLMRTNDQMRVMADGFKKFGIPFQAADRRRLFKRRGVIELVALLKLISGAGGYSDFVRAAEVIAPALGKKVVRAFKQWGLKNRLAVKDAMSAATRFPISGLSRSQQIQLADFAGRLSVIAQETAHFRTTETIVHLKSIPAIFRLLDDDDSHDATSRLEALSESSGFDHKGFIDRLTLQSDADIYHPRAEKTALLTMHAAKGLEFPIVIIAGCETGFIPFQRQDQAPVDVDEERRLFYVAITRARQRLYLTSARRRQVFGKTVNRERSVFLKNIEESLLKDESPRSKGRKTRADQLQLF
jgi:DNA helicase-2/ATP-dependent DNA helicase PcrA